MKGDKAAAAANGDQEGRQMKGDKAAAAANGDQEGRQMKGDKAAAASRPFGDCAISNPVFEK